MSGKLVPDSLWEQIESLFPEPVRSPKSKQRFLSQAMSQKPDLESTAGQWREP